MSDLAARHRDVVALLSDDGSASVAFAGDDGSMLATALDEVAAAPDANLAIAPSDYLELFRSLIAERVVRPPAAAGRRVRIFGLLEARLQNVDRLVLGGLVEGTWPPDTRSDAWLSRPMRHDLGLDLPERRIGLTAHDFAQALGAPEVILTRAAKLAGAPTLWSRFVQRLAAVAGETQWDTALNRGARYLDLAHALDRPQRVEQIKAPAPKPPLAARPRASQRHPDRGLAARPLYDLCPARAAPEAARGGRYAAGRRRSRIGHARIGRGLHQRVRRTACRPIRSPS